MGILFYHEGCHAKDYFNFDDSVINSASATLLGKKDISEFYLSILEIRAFENQIKNLWKRNFSDYYKLDIFS